MFAAATFVPRPRYRGAFRQFGGHADGNGRRWSDEGRRRKRKVGGRLADEDGNRVFVLGAGYAYINGLSEGCFQDGAGLLDVDLGSKPPLKRSS